VLVLDSVLALEEFFVEVDEKNTTLQLFYSLKNKQYMKSKNYEHVSLRLKLLTVT